MCKKVNFDCGPDTYLKGDVCTGCPPGTIKPGRGYGPCLPITLSLKKTSIQPNNSVVANTSKPSKTSSVIDTVNFGSQTNKSKTEHVPETADEKQSLLQGQMATIVISVSTLFVVILGLGIFLMKRSQKGPKVLEAECGRPDDPEKGELMNEGAAPEQAPPFNPNLAMFNIALIFPRSDEELAYRIKEELNRMVLKDRRKVKTWDFNDPSFGGSKLEFPRQFTSVCPLTLVLLTCNTSKDIDCKYMIEEAVALTRLGEEERQRYCVRPLHTIPEDKRTYDIPAGLDSVSAVEWGRRNLGELLNYLSDAETASEKSGSANSDSPLLKS